MERLKQKFADLRSLGETAFIPFSVAGYPDEKTSMKIFLKMAHCGGDVIEFGFPFSDPVADGPAIQKAAAMSIRNGMTMDRSLDMCAGIRQQTDIPIIFFSYFNPIHKYGTEKFASRAKESGVDGVLLVDLPLEETCWLKPVTDKAGLAWTFLVTPTTPLERVRSMSQQGSGFLYYVSVTGVTGARSALPDDLSSKCAEVKALSRLPLAVGFGVSTPSQASFLRPHVDGVVIGSAIINRAGNGGSMAELGAWLKEIKAALRA